MYLALGGKLGTEDTDWAWRENQVPSTGLHGACCEPQTEPLPGRGATPLASKPPGPWLLTCGNLRPVGPGLTRLEPRPSWLSRKFRFPASVESGAQPGAGQPRVQQYPQGTLPLPTLPPAHS